MTLPDWYGAAALALAFGAPFALLISARGGRAARWAPLAALALLLAPEAELEVPGLLLGARFAIDTLSRWTLLLSLAGFVTLGALSGNALSGSRLACSALVVAWLGALCQCLSADLVLFLAGGAMLGFGLLALALALPHALPPGRAGAIAVLLVAGDLALLELVMLLVKSAGAADFGAAGAALAGQRGEPLAAFCLAVGFGARVALVFPALPTGSATAVAARLLPGWAVPGLCAGAALLRLNCAGGEFPACAARSAEVLWWALPLALLAWLLPRALPRCAALGADLGARLAAWRNRYSAGLGRSLSGAAKALRPALDIERGLGQWRVAMTLAVLLAAALALATLSG